MPIKQHKRAGRAAGLAALALALCGQAEPVAPTYERLAGEARAARERQDYPTYLARVGAMAAILPGHPASHYSHARGLSLAGDRAGAIALLNRLAELGFAYDPRDDPAFAALRDDPGFTAAARRLAANGARHGGTTLALELGMAGQQPEGIALVAGGYLVGTLKGRIHRSGAQITGASREIAAVGWTVAGIPDWAVAGIRPDEANGTFLACVTDEAGGHALVQRHRLADGTLLGMHALPSSGGFCNDITLLPGGFAVTDSPNGRVFVLREGRLAPLAIPPLFYPNGIAVDPRSGRLYVAHGNGIIGVDPASGESHPLEPDGTLLGGIDGMVWHEGALIAMQNVTQPARLLRITPGEDGRSARVEPILSGDPQLAGATTVAVADGQAVVLSQTGIPDGTPPDNPILLRVPL